MKHPNIVWFITDDTNVDMLGYAGGTVLTPAIDRIAHEGVVCTQYHCSSPACCPSRFSYLTGLHPGHSLDSRFRGAFPPGQPYSIGFNVQCEPSMPTIASVLKGAGYRTGFVGKWHAGSPRRSFHGHTYREDDDPSTPEVARKLHEDYRSMQAELRGIGFDYADSISWGNTDNRPLKALQYHNLEWHTHGALEFLGQCADSGRPFFLNMATTTIHGPHHVESLETDGRATEWGLLDTMPQVQAPRATVFERLKAAGIEVTHRSAGALWTDDAFGAVVQRVEEMGVADNTIFIFSTDHGVGVTSGKFTCYQGGVSIPHALKWAGHLTADTTCNALLQNVDFMPTLLEAAGVSVPADMHADGLSRWAQLRGAPDDREDLYFEWGSVRAVRTSKWKYIAYRPTATELAKMTADGATVALNYSGKPSPDYCMHHYPHYFEQDQLYDLETDPTEQHNLAHDPAHVLTLSEMKQRLQRRLDAFDHPFDLAPIAFLETEHYRTQCRNLREDQKIFQTYFYLERAY